MRIKNCEQCKYFTKETITPATTAGYCRLKPPTVINSGSATTLSKKNWTTVWPEVIPTKDVCGYGRSESDECDPTIF